VRGREFLETLFISAKSRTGDYRRGMRIAHDLSVFLDHPSLLLLVAFLAVLLREVLKALGF